MNIFKKIWNKIKTYTIEYYKRTNDNIEHGYTSPSPSIIEIQNDINIINDNDMLKDIPSEYRNDIIWNVLNKPVGGRWEIEKYRILKSRIEELLGNDFYIPMTPKFELFEEFLTKEDMEI